MPDYLLNRLEQHLLTHRERSLLRLCRQELQSIEAQAERLRISIDPDKRLGDSLSIQSGVLLGRISSLTKKLVSLSSARQDIRDANRRQPCSPSLNVRSRLIVGPLLEELRLPLVPALEGVVRRPALQDGLWSSPGLMDTFSMMKESVFHAENEEPVPCGVQGSDGRSGAHWAQC